MIANFKLHRPERYSEGELQAFNKIGHALFGVLEAAQKSFTYETLKLSRQDLEELSAVVVEFAEDILHEIGIWKSLEKYNQSFIESPSISPEFVEKLAGKHGAESIAEAFLIRDVSGIDYLMYILRQYKGEYSRQRYPSISFKN